MDEQLYLMAVGLSLEEKVKKAIETFRIFEHEALKRDPVNGYYLCDSYGKDSCVILELAKRSGVKFQAHHNLTTLDPPELIMFGRKHHPETVVHKPAINMLTRMTHKNNGPPTRLSRWCCSEYKESAGRESVCVFGVRAFESARRKAQWRVWTPMRKHESFVLNPILYWTDSDVWLFLKSNKIPYSSLYDEGAKRLGCIGCPMAGDGRKRDFARWPKYEQAWKNAFRKFWKNWHGVPRETTTWVPIAEFVFPLQGVESIVIVEGVECVLHSRRWFDNRGWTSWEDMWNWWMEENQPEAEDDCQMGLF